MLNDFWTGLGGKLADRWLALIFSPAFVFWTGGLAAWVWRYGRTGVKQHGWHVVLARWAAVLEGLPAVAQVALLIGLLAGVLVSGLAVQRLSAPVMRLLEGYWPKLLWRWREALSGRLSEKADIEAKRLRELAAQDQSKLTAKETAEYLRLDRRRRRMPSAGNRRMPTRLGNILRAAESRPNAFHGLDAVVCWPRLWLILPDASKREVTQARASLNAAVQLWLWGVLFIVWTVWAWWALPLGLLVATVTYYSRMLSAAAVYGDLLESCFDVHRWLLYHSLRWPLPATPADEQRCGKQLTAYLWRGSTASAPTFTAAGDTQAPKARVASPVSSEHLAQRRQARDDRTQA